MRWALCGILAVALNLALFQFMAALVARHRLGLRPVMNAHRIDFVRIPQAEEPPPPSHTRAEPPPPLQSKTAPATSAQPSAPLPANVRQLPLPVPGLKFEVPLSMDVGVAVPPLPSVLVEGEPGAVPGPVRIPPPKPGFIWATELTPLVRTPPLYPPQAKRRGIEGEVVVEFSVTEAGKVKDPRIIESRPPGVFDRAVLAAVRRWRFKPKMKDGRPVAVQARQRLVFELRR